MSAFNHCRVNVCIYVCLSNIALWCYDPRFEFGFIFLMRFPMSYFIRINDALPWGEGGGLGGH